MARNRNAALGLEGRAQIPKIHVRGVYLSADRQIWFFKLYDKDEAADLTTGEKKVLKKAIQAELEVRRRKP